MLYKISLIRFIRTSPEILLWWPLKGYSDLASWFEKAYEPYFILHIKTVSNRIKFLQSTNKFQEKKQTFDKINLAFLNF